MLPEPHVCCVCKREVVYTDCLPAVCFGCREAEQIVKAPGELPTPDVTVTPTPSLRESK